MRLWFEWLLWFSQSFYQDCFCFVSDPKLEVEFAYGNALDEDLLGNGVCNLHLNNEENLFDIRDCWLVTETICQLETHGFYEIYHDYVNDTSVKEFDCPKDVGMYSVKCILNWKWARRWIVSRS